MTRSVLAPATANIAPPGHYLLFIVNGSGVPSIGSTVQLAASTPVPATLTSLSPSSTAAGDPAFTLTVNGTGFVSGAIVRWNGANRTTTFVTSNQLTAATPATDIATAGTPQVTVVNPGASPSNALPFTVTAGATTFRLTVTRNGSDSSRGTVTSSPAGINCGNTCSSAFTSGTVVTFTARVSGNRVFAGWSGACTGTGTCTVTMNADKSVTTTFNRH